MYSLLNTEVNNNSKRLKTSLPNETCLWHLRLGYIALYMIQRLVKDSTLSFLEVGPSPEDESYLEGEMTEKPFRSKCNRAKELLELVQGDVYMNVKA